MTSSRKRPSGAGLARWIVPTVAALVTGGIATVASSREIEAKNPARGRMVPAGPLRIHLLEKGEGPPVLLIHGNAVTAEDWLASGIFGDLAQDCRVLAPDRPGCGHSERPRGRLWTPAAQANVLARLLDRLGIAEAVVVGHSLGTQVALRLALDHPRLVRGLVLVSGYYFPTARVDSLAAAPAALPLIGDLWRHTLAQPLARAFTGPTVEALFAPQAPPEGYGEGPFQMALRPGQLRATSADAAYMLTEAGAIAERLHEVRVPTVVLAGSGDRIIDWEAQSRALAEQLPNASFELVEGLGHMMHHAVPERVAAAVRRLAVAKEPEAAT